jgi:hypothetical protein
VAQKVQGIPVLGYFFLVHCTCINLCCSKVSPVKCAMTFCAEKRARSTNIIELGLVSDHRRYQITQDNSSLFFGIPFGTCTKGLHSY